MIDTIRQLLQQHGRLHARADSLALDADLYDAGLTPFAAIRVMLAVEEAFDVEFPVAMLRRQSFASIASIVACLETLSPRAGALERRAA